MMVDLTPKRLAELRRIAEAATPGPWWADGWEARTKDGDRFIASIAPAFQGAKPDASCWELDANIRHIAAFDPTTALELIDALTATRAEAERWRKKYEELKAGLEELIRHVRLVLPEVRIAQVPVSRTGDHSRRCPARRIG